MHMHTHTRTRTRTHAHTNTLLHTYDLIYTYPYNPLWNCSTNKVCHTEDQETHERYKQTICMIITIIGELQLETHAHHSMDASLGCRYGN